MCEAQTLVVLIVFSLLTTDEFQKFVLLPSMEHEAISSLRAIMNEAESVMRLSLLPRNRFSIFTSSPRERGLG